MTNKKGNMKRIAERYEGQKVASNWPVRIYNPNDATRTFDVSKEIPIDERILYIIKEDDYDPDVSHRFGIVKIQKDHSAKDEFLAYYYEGEDQQPLDTPETFSSFKDLCLSLDERIKKFW